MKPTTLLWCATIVAACASISTPDPTETARLDEARRLLDSQPDEALTITDDVLRNNPQSREARLIAAEGSMRLARNGRGQSALLLQDAVRNFNAVLATEAEQGEPDVHRQLAECYHDLGEFELGSQTARRAAEHYTAANTAAGKRQAADALLLAGRCDYQQFVTARRAELDGGAKKDAHGLVPPGEDTARLATRAAAEFGGARAVFPGEATTQIAAIHQWLGQHAAVGQELERGIRSDPQETSIHDAYIKWMASIGQQDAMVGAYSRFVRESPGIPLLRWYQGRAVFARADRLRTEGNFQGATAGYEKARGLFGEYLAMVPAHADATNQWLALCSLSSCRTAVEMGDTRSAQRHLFAAADASPLAVTYDDGKPRLIDSFGSHFSAAAFAVHRCLADSGDQALEKALAFNEAVLERCPDQWGFVYNNAALAARDLGVQKANDGDEAAAQELWERSYRYYEKAVVLSPDDARIVNDCGLMLIYHLDRDFDRARALFDQAIAVGQPQLEALPRDTDPRERERLEEAIGDAWQNIAVLQREHQKAPFATYRPFCEQAVRYFPYQRREAAKLLREEGEAALGSTARGRAGTAPAAAQGGAAEALAKVATAVHAKVAGMDFDGALALLDGIAKDCREHAPYHRLRGDLTLQFARQSRDTNRKGTALLYEDAVTALKRAVELDSEPPAPRQQLGEAQYEAGQLDDAAATASSLLLHLQSQGGGKPDEVLAAHTLRANAAARAYAAKKADKVEDNDLLTAARSSFRLLEEKGRLDADLRSLWSTTEQWAGAPAEATNVLVRALRASPDDQVLLAALVDTAAGQKQLPLAIEALQGRTDATGLWYLGRARYLQAGEQREGGKANDALKTLDAARQSFLGSMESNADYRDSCEQWVAMCLGKKGNIAFRMGDTANAERWLLESVRLRPDRIGEDLGLQETTKMGIVLVADKFYQQKDLGKVEAIYRTASDAANSDLDLLNNSGLFARDHGNQLERAGKNKEAMAMYEQSYKAYSRAHELDPQNVRLRNDCALIAIYHLERDWDLAKGLLDAAIADGEKTLRDDAPSDPDERQKLDEAVGDCYENLALWHLKHSKDAAAAKAAAERSKEHYPGARRPGAQRHLQDAERMLRSK